MQSSKQDNYIYGNSEWFIAKLTAVCPPDPDLEDCGNYTCSWQQYSYCPSMQKFLPDALELMSGDCLEGFNVAVPISEQDPTALIDSFVLMRQRGATDTVYNIYEFISMGSSPAPVGDSSCFSVKSVSCSNNILLVTLADSGGCISCVGGLAFYTYGARFEVPTNTNTPIPNRWSLVAGDLEPTGLTIDGNNWVNSSGQTITLKVTLQLYFTPEGTGSQQSRWASIVRNEDTSDIPVASFAASNQTYTALECSNAFTLANGQTFTPYVFQDGGNNIYVGGPERVPTTLLIERLCT